MASLDPGGSAALPSAPSPAASAAGQESNGGYSGWKGHDVVQRLTFEAGGGFNAPAGDKAYITWGGQFTVGGGVNFSKRFALLAEYQFLDDKLPGHIIAEAGAQGGHVHLWSFTLDPVVSLFPKSNNDVYVTGGYGFYRKVTSFTDVEPTEYCYFYCGTAYESQTVGHFSSNQGGFNIGGGYQHRLGGMYGDSKTRLFAEVRYVDALTPAVVAYPNGLAETTVGADTKVIPISVGVRW
ncbi:MAG: outer membrane beta-barrel protein [Terracidiphilus sp.]